MYCPYRKNGYCTQDDHTCMEDEPCRIFNEKKERTVNGMNDEVMVKLDELADLQMGQTALQLRKQEEIDQVITPEVKARLAEIDAKYLGESEDLQSKIAVLDYDIRAAVLKLGASIKGNRLHAVWAKGRVTWDTKSLDGYAAGHPEIAQFRKEGAATVSIRSVKVD